MKNTKMQAQGELELKLRQDSIESKYKHILYINLQVKQS